MLAHKLRYSNYVDRFVGGHSIGTMAMEAEYTLPQHTSNMNAMPQEDHRRIAPEPYASSAIYTELNYQVIRQNI